MDIDAASERPQNYCRRKKFDGTIASECYQRGAMRYPRGNKRNRRFNTNPDDCECLNSVNLAESVLVWTQRYGNHFRIIAFGMKKWQRIAAIDLTLSRVHSAWLTGNLPFAANPALTITRLQDPSRSCFAWAPV